MTFITPLTKAFTNSVKPTTPTTTTGRSHYRTAKMTLRADLDHVALDCKNSAQLHAFYRDVLQFEHMQMPHAPFPSVRVSDITILDFMQSTKPRGLEGANHMCFSVSKDDIDSLKHRLREAGIDVAEPKLRGGARGRGWSVYVTDPEGNVLEFRYYD